MISKERQYIVAIGDGYLWQGRAMGRVGWIDSRDMAARFTAREATLIVEVLNYSCVQNVQRIRLK